MLLTTDGLIIKELKSGEDDRLITILTRDNGLLRVYAKNARKMKNRGSSATGLLCYSRFVIFSNRDKYILNEAEPIEIFFDIRSDIEKLALAQYFCELSLSLVPEHDKSEDFLRLMLNSLYMLMQNKREALQLKAIAELRMLTLAGYMPNLVMCDKCGAYESDDMMFLPEEGIIICAKCLNSNISAYPVPPGVLQAMRHIVYSSLDKLFSFTLSKQSLILLNQASEAFLLNKTSRTYKTLDFFNAIIS